MNLFFRKIFFCQGDGSSGKQEDTDQVRDSHKSVEGFCNAPEQSEIDRCSDDGYQGVGDHEWFYYFFGKQELDAACSVKSPADDRGESEAAHGNCGENRYPVSVCSGKSGDCQLGTGSSSVVDRNTTHQDNKSSQSTDDDRVGKYFENTEHTLFYRFAGVGTGVGDGTGTKSGFIGKDTAGDAFFQAQEETSDHTAGDSSRIEGSVNDRMEYSRNSVKIQDNHTDRQNNVEQCHKRNQFFRNTSDSFDAAKQNHADKKHDHNTKNQIQCFGCRFRNDMEIDQCRIDRSGDRIYLCGISGTENGQHPEGRIKNRKNLPFFTQSVFDVVHRAADVVPVFVSLAEMNGKRYLGEFRAHSKDCGDPHPEYSTGTANRDRTGNTGDISGTDRSGEGGTDSLERSHGTVGSLFLFENSSERSFQCIREFANLDKSGSQA